MSREVQRKFEDYAYVLDYVAQRQLSGGRSSYRAESRVQLVGESFFTLLEAVPRSDSTISAHERVYIGKMGVREKISHIVGRIEYEDLTSTAKIELPIALESIVENNQDKFIQFFNTAQAVTTRMHSLELIPGIGKKFTWSILEARERKPFESFEELKERVGLSDPLKLIAKRVLEELVERTIKYRLFTRTP